MGFYNNIRKINHWRIKWLVQQPSFDNWDLTFNCGLLPTKPQECTRRQLQRALKVGYRLLRSLPQERRND